MTPGTPVASWVGAAYPGTRQDSRRCWGAHLRKSAVIDHLEAHLEN